MLECLVRLAMTGVQPLRWHGAAGPNRPIQPHPGTVTVREEEWGEGKQVLSTKGSLLKARY